MELETIVVGHVTVDVNVLSHGIIENILGGAPTYAGFALASLGRDVGIVSKVGQDFPEYFPPLFGKFGLNTEGILTTPGVTTKFENTYREGGKREQVCKEMADPINSKDIPRSYLDAESFYVSPVVREVPVDTLSKISEGGGITMLDPQGLFRKVDDSGKVSLEKPSDLQDYLSNVDIVKIGNDEFQTFEEPEEEVLENLIGMGPEVSILTLGGKGCVVCSDGEFTRIESLDVKVEDLTGAGDVFGAAFLSNYIDNEDPVQSAKFATVAAGLKIEYKGSTGFPSEEEIKEAL